MTAAGNPYAASFDAYWRAGWRGVLPVPYGQKKSPPEGFTGHDGGDPSYADCATWGQDGPRNVALRLPDTVVGLDVDTYDGKPGEHAYAALTQECGSLPPTVRCTSRGFDQPSCIRFFRIPPGARLVSGLPGIEVIQHHHRYAMVAPSVHPSGARYRWLDERTGVLDRVPAVSDIPELPTEWLERLRDDSRAGSERADLDDGQVWETLAVMPAGKPCDHVRRGAAKVFDGAGRHDGYRDAVLAVVGAGRRGCPGAVGTLQQMQRTFLHDVTALDQDAGARRDRRVAQQEWARMLNGAVRIAAADHPDQGRHCVEDVPAWVPEGGQSTEPVQNDPLEASILEATAKLWIQDRAKERVVAAKAQRDYQPPPAVGLPTLIDAVSQERVRWRWEGLAEIGDRTLVEAKAKAGKTTLLGNMVRSVVTGDALLDRFATAALPHDARLVYIDTELGQRRLARWMADMLPEPVRERVLVWSIAGRAGGLDVRDDTVRALMAAQLGDALAGAEAGLLIVDVASAWTSPLGIEENDNGAVRAFCEALHAFTLDLGAQGVVLAHHTGHNGDRSRGASAWRDWPDVFITLTRNDDDQDDARYLSAYGRDVHVPESRLTYDPTTRLLSLTGGVGVSRRAAKRAQSAAAYVPTVVQTVREKPGLNTSNLRSEVIKELDRMGVTAALPSVGEAVTRADREGLIVNIGSSRERNWQVP